jgi:hypothetical protein
VRMRHNQNSPLMSHSASACVCTRLILKAVSYNIKKSLSKAEGDYVSFSFGFSSREDR